VNVCGGVYVHTQKPRFSIHDIFHFDPSPRHSVIGRNRRSIEN